MKFEMITLEGGKGIFGDDMLCMLTEEEMKLVDKGLAPVVTPARLAELVKDEAYMRVEMELLHPEMF